MQKGRAFFLILFCLTAVAAPASAEVRCEFGVTRTADDTAAVSIRFSERVTGFSSRDLDVRGGTLRNLNETAPGSRFFVGTIVASEAEAVAPLRLSIRRGRVRGMRSRAGNERCLRTFRKLSLTDEDPDADPDAFRPPLDEPDPGSDPDIDAEEPPSETPVDPPSEELPGETRPPSEPEAPIAPVPDPTSPLPDPSPTAVPKHPVVPGTGSTAPNTCSTAPEVESSLPVFPGAEGYGVTTVAGSGRHLRTPCTKIYRVDTLRDSGPGSLRDCVEAKGPRTCVFEVAGMIWATKDLRVTSPYLTVAGQTAPSPGIFIRGSTFTIEASDVLIQHVAMRVGDDPRPDCCKANSCSSLVAPFCTADPGGRDGIKIRASSAPVRRVVLDHVSVSWALDEGMSIVPDKEISDVTISRALVSSGLDLSIHPEASNPADLGHSKGMLVNGKNGVVRMSFHKNLFAHNADRNIRIATPVSMEYLNNVVYDWGRGRGAGRTVELTNKVKAVHSIDMIGNAYIPGPDTFCPTTQYEPELCREGGGDGIDTPAEQQRMHYLLRVGSGVGSGLSALSRYFLADNIGPTKPLGDKNEWNAADSGFFTKGLLRFLSNKASAPVTPSGTVRVLPALDAVGAVLNEAGARPADRDAVDAATVTDVASGTGRIINCVANDGSARCAKNAGGWPNYGVTYDAEVLPEDPAGDDDGDGYTNLEEHLFAAADAVE